MSNLNPGGLTRVLNYIKTWVTGLLNGKANSSHTHTKSQITDFPTIPTVNNATLTIQKNGTTVNSFTANASSNVTANITVPTKVSELTNDSGYITSSSSITGTAATASKLATARSISADGLEFQGSANFDGSGNIKLNITHHRSLVTIGNTNNYPFHRIAYTAQETGNWLDRVITFFIGREYSGGGYGICRIALRTNDAANGATASCVVQWLVRTADIPVDAIQVGFNNTAAASYIDVFYKSSGGWGNATCRVISHANSRSNVGQGFTVVSTSTEVDNTTTSNPLTSTESYATIAAAGTKIRGKAYTSTITASDTGIVNSANSCSGNAANVTGTVAIGHGGTGATTRLGAVQNLTNENVGTSTEYFLTITTNWGKAGYCSVANAKSVLGVPTNTNQLTNGAGFITSSGSCNYANSAGSAPANGGTSTATAYMNQYSTITYGVNRLQYYNVSTSTTSGATNNANPYNDWFYHLLMSHGNNNGYYGDIALCFHSNTLAFRRITSGSDNGWCYIVKNGRTIVSGYEVYVG